MKEEILSLKEIIKIQQEIIKGYEDSFAELKQGFGLGNII